MKGYHSNIEKDSLENNNFRKVLYTGQNLQLVLMSLKPGEEIGMEVHTENDQFLRFEEGSCVCVINGNEYEIEDGSAVIIPAGTEHNVINTSTDKSLKLYTIYAPPHHKDGTIHTTKEDAENSDEDFDGETSE